MSTSSINQITLTSTEFLGLLFLLSRVLSIFFYLSCSNTQFVIHHHMNSSVQQSTRNSKSILYSHSAYEKSRRIHHFFLLQVTLNSLQQCPSMRHATELSGICHNFFKYNTKLWHGDECGKDKSNENFKTAIPSNNYDRPKTTGECGMF